MRVKPCAAQLCCMMYKTAIFYSTKKTENKFAMRNGITANNMPSQNEAFLCESKEKVLIKVKTIFL